MAKYIPFSKSGLRYISEGFTNPEVIHEKRRIFFVSMEKRGKEDERSADPGDRVAHRGFDKPLAADGSFHNNMCPF
jgi:hypothetical protein